jgi:hypothetical protein
MEKEVGGGWLWAVCSPWFLECDRAFGFERASRGVGVYRKVRSVGMRSE